MWLLLIILWQKVLINTGKPLSLNGHYVHNYTVSFFIAVLWETPATSCLLFSHYSIFFIWKFANKVRSPPHADTTPVSHSHMREYIWYHASIHTSEAKKIFNCVAVLTAALYFFLVVVLLLGEIFLFASPMLTNAKPRSLQMLLSLVNYFYRALLILKQLFVMF